MRLLNYTKNYTLYISIKIPRSFISRDRSSIKIARMIINVIL